MGMCCMTAGSRNWGPGTAWRGRTGWEAGGRLKREGTCVPMADSC